MALTKDEKGDLRSTLKVLIFIYHVSKQSRKDESTYNIYALSSTTKQHVDHNQRQNGVNLDVKKSHLTPKILRPKQIKNYILPGNLSGLP